MPLESVLRRALQEFSQRQEEHGLKAYDQWRNLALKLTGTGATAARAVERAGSGSFGGAGGAGPGADPFASGAGGCSLCKRPAPSWLSWSRPALPA